MAVSGTSTFSLTRDELIKASLRVLEVIGVGETPIAEDYTNCSQALNVIIKSWAKKGLPLWVTQDIPLPLAVGVTQYSIGPTAAGINDLVMAKPMRIISAFLRSVDNRDTPLTMLSRQEYIGFSNKTSPGAPYSFYYDVQEANGIVSFLNAPVVATDVVHLQVQRQFYDMNLGVETFDFPQEWYQALKWGLAAELGSEYGIDLQRLSYYEQKAAMALEECFNYSVEEASVYFTVRDY